MALLAVIGGILLALALIARELQGSRERAAQTAALHEVQSALERTRQQLRRTQEDLYVMQSLLAERNILDEAELARGRLRLIETPKRLAAEREAVVRHLGASPTELVVDENVDKIH